MELYLDPVIMQTLADFEVNEGIEADDFPREIARVLDFIEEHIFDVDFSVERLKWECALRNNNLSSRFKLLVGYGIQEYVEKRRMEAAKKLLAMDDLKIYHIAAAVGYAYHETFCRAFKRVEGYTPSEYQSRHAHYGNGNGHRECPSS